MQNLVLKNEIQDYLSESQYINWKDTAILEKAKEFQENSDSEINLVKNIYEFVRDDIPHSWDVQDKRVTKAASEVLEQGVGICWAKANLLAALLRACNIPAGICYQRLTLGDTPETGFCIHALNAVYMKDLNRWIRLDARGNKNGADAQFSLDTEQLAFSVKPEYGEVDYGEIYAHPSEKLMKVLEENEDALEMYMHRLPDLL